MVNKNMTTQLLTFREAMEFLRINKGTLYRLIHNSDIPAFKVGNLWRIYKEELINWLEKQRPKT